MPNNKRRSNDMAYFHRNPLILQMHQQEVRLRATIEAIRDSHIKQLSAMEDQKKFIETFFQNKVIADATQEFLHQHYAKDQIDRAVNVIKGYLLGLGITFENTDSFDGLAGLFKLRGMFDKWHVEKIESLKESFDKALEKIFELQRSQQQPSEENS
jgi:hypothetical protein